MPKQQLRVPQIDARTVIVVNQSAGDGDGVPWCPTCCAHSTRAREDGSFECPECHAHVVSVRTPFVPSRESSKKGVKRSGEGVQIAGHA